MAHVEIWRQIVSRESTIGECRWNGVFHAWSLEDVVRPPGIKVYGKTAIPAGTDYILLPYQSPKHGRVPRVWRELGGRLHEPEGFGYIEIHPLNRAEQSLGCIGLGLIKGRDFIAKSRDAQREFMALFDTAIARGERVALSIRNPVTGPL